MKNKIHSITLTLDEKNNCHALVWRGKDFNTGARLYKISRFSWERAESIASIYSNFSRELIYGRSYQFYF